MKQTHANPYFIKFDYKYRKKYWYWLRRYTPNSYFKKLTELLKQDSKDWDRVYNLVGDIFDYQIKDGNWLGYLLDKNIKQYGKNAVINRFLLDIYHTSARKQVRNIKIEEFKEDIKEEKKKVHYGYNRKGIREKSHIVYKLNEDGTYKKKLISNETGKSLRFPKYMREKKK